jgi:membrane-bound serine protease (ClpP class)
MDRIAAAVWELLDALTGGLLSGAGRGAAADALTVEEAHRTEERRARAALVGRTGVAITSLRPAGRVAIEGKEYPALAEGPMLEPGCPVLVVGISSFALAVREAGR